MIEFPRHLSSNASSVRDVGEVLQFWECPAWMFRDSWHYVQVVWITILLLHMYVGRTKNIDKVALKGNGTMHQSKSSTRVEVVVIHTPLLLLKSLSVPATCICTCSYSSCYLYPFQIYVYALADNLCRPTRVRTVIIIIEGIDHMLCTV